MICISLHQYTPWYKLKIWNGLYQDWLNLWFYFQCNSPASSDYGYGGHNTVMYKMYVMNSVAIILNLLWFKAEFLTIFAIPIGSGWRFFPLQAYQMKPFVLTFGIVTAYHLPCVFHLRLLAVTIQGGWALWGHIFFVTLHVISLQFTSDQFR